ncbi:hypothetical protein FOA43_004681 [Brettanomyces nanus]|uniref:Nucleoporin NUP188 n=1 Tax=Eeniella nana TaxID=13502 RepID=A0A875S8R7_EENNA|nr:uncharacterized protein FOA43_004681 [Brettanomyces nanus]QPG77273.1 hypothetical protein FOA43_004681 [Brettanomyces nanus]
MASKLQNKSSVSQPVSDWTFEQALLLLREEKQGPREDKMLNHCLDLFLGANSDVFTQSALAFIVKNTGSISLTSSKGFTIRGVQYDNDLSNVDIEYAKEISQMLSINPMETLRIMVAASKRIPDTHPLRLTEEDSKFWLLDSDKTEAMSYYTSRILREQRTIIRICILLIKEKRIASTTANSEKISASLMSNGYKLIESQLDFVEFIANQILHRCSENSLDKLVRQEYYLILLDLLNYLSYSILASKRGFTKPTVARWFGIMEKTGNLSNITKKMDSKEMASTMEGLATVISILFLDLDFNFGSLEDDSSFMNDPQDMSTITSSILNTVANPIVLYAWAIVLHRKHTVLSSELDHPKTKAFITKFQSLESIESTFISLAEEAARLNVSSALLKCHKLLSYDNVYCNILASFAVASVPYVKMADEITSGIAEIMSTASDDVVKRFFDNSASEDMLSLARAKMPLSLRSFIALVSINTNLALEEFQTISSYMQVFSQSEFCYKYAIDDENPDLIKLIRDVDVFPPYENGKELSLLLREGTKAQILPGGGGVNKDKIVVAFIYEYSGWALLGRVLKNLSTRLDDDVEKLLLLTQSFELLAKVFKEADKATVDNVIYALNAFVGENDIIEIVFRILDQALVLRTVKLLSSCMKFVCSLTCKGYSYRVWSYLYKSNLLGLQPNGGLAATVMGTTEMVSGEFTFTLSLLELSELLVRDCIRIDAKVSRKLKAQVLDRLLAHFVQLFENFTNWKYLLSHQRLQIGCLCVGIFNMILKSLYGVDDQTELDKRVNGTFFLASKRIIGSFLVYDSSVPRSIKPLAALIDSTASSYTDPISSDLCGLWWSRWFQDSFHFCSTLIKVRSVTKSATLSSLELALYARLPNLVNIYLNNMDKRQLIVEILTNLVGAKCNSEPPSLLTHLRQTHTEILLRCLSIDMSSKAETYGLKIALYDLFSSVMEGGQEGLSIVFITGRDIKDSLQNPSKNSHKAFSLLRILKQDVSIIRQYPSNVAIHMADAIALAFSSWTSAEQQADDTQFVSQLLDKLDDFPKSAVSGSCADPTAFISYCYEVRLLSKLAEILSLYLFVLKNTQSKRLILKRLNESSFIDHLASKFKVVGYKEFLQEAVKDRFHSVWPQFQLSQFIRASGYKEHRFGLESVYSFPLLEMLLGTSEQWPSIKHEIADASVNTQYFSVQVSVAKSFAALITCICKVDGKNMNPGYLQVAESLLRACDEEGVPSQLFQDLFRVRIELAFYICLSFSKRVNFKVDSGTLLNVIISASRLLDSKEIGLLQSLLNMKVSYYKPLLRILLICLDLVPSEFNVVEFSATFCDIYSEILCRATKLLFDSIRTNALASPKAELGSSRLIAKQVDDVILVMKMFKSFLRLNLPEDLQHSVANATINTGAYRSLASLYSVSHLIKVNDEEIFADFALMFIYELVRNKTVAHSLVRNGLFTVLIESPISVRIQAGNAKPYPISMSRLQHLWADGLLPIVLTVMGYFGDTVLAEACLFVTAFEKQINSTIQAWYETDSPISTKFIEETSQIILLAKALNSLDAYNYIRNSAITEDTSELVRLVPGLDTEVERHKLSIALSYLISHPKYLTLRIVPSSAEEQRTLQSDDSMKFTEEVVCLLKELKSSLE